MLFAGYGWNPVFRPKMRQCDSEIGRVYRRSLPKINGTAQKAALSGDKSRPGAIRKRNEIILS
jgi:hypothetical protein